MKLSSISLIAVALAAIAGSAAADPARRPFERDVNIYSRSNPAEHHKAAVIHRDSARANLQAYNDALKVGLPDRAVYHFNAMQENVKHMNGHKKASTGGPAYPMSTIKDGMSTHKEADETIAEAKKEAAACHRRAAAYNRWASHDAKALGLHDDAAFHDSIAEENDKHAQRHTEDALENGHASNLLTTDYAYRTQRWASETIEKVKNRVIALHEDAAKGSRQASREAKKMGLLDHAAYYENHAKLNEQHRDYHQGAKDRGQPSDLATVADAHFSKPLKR